MIEEPRGALAPWELLEMPPMSSLADRSSSAMDHWRALALGNISDLIGNIKPFQPEPEHLAYDQLSEKVKDCPLHWWALSHHFFQVTSAPVHKGQGECRWEGAQCCLSFRRPRYMIRLQKIAFVESKLYCYLQHCCKHQGVIFLPQNWPEYLQTFM